MVMPGRNYNNGTTKDYRYGFNGKENDNEVKGEGNTVAFEARIYDSRLGRWFAVDAYAHKYPDNSPYTFCINSPLQYKDANGHWLVDKYGNIIYTVGETKHEIIGNEIFSFQFYYFYTNDGQRVQVRYYGSKTSLDNAILEGNEKDGTLKILGVHSTKKVFGLVKGDDYKTFNCHGNSLNFPVDLRNIDWYVPGLDNDNLNNVEKVYKNAAEFTPVRAEDVKPGDIAIFGTGGQINHTATVTKVGKNGKNVRLTSKDDRNKIAHKLTIEEVQNSNENYANFMGYYRHNSNFKIANIEVTDFQGRKGAAGDVDGQQIKNILEARREQEKAEEIIRTVLGSL
jgi:RHS repeat-associated protein